MSLEALFKTFSLHFLLFLWLPEVRKKKKGSVVVLRDTSCGSRKALRPRFYTQAKCREGEGSTEHNGVSGEGAEEQVIPQVSGVRAGIKCNRDNGAECCCGDLLHTFIPGTLRFIFVNLKPDCVLMTLSSYHGFFRSFTYLFCC